MGRFNIIKYLFKKYKDNENIYHEYIAEILYTASENGDLEILQYMLKKICKKIMQLLKTKLFG